MLRNSWPSLSNNALLKQVMTDLKQSIEFQGDRATSLAQSWVFIFFLSFLAFSNTRFCCFAVAHLGAQRSLIFPTKLHFFHFQTKRFLRSAATRKSGFKSNLENDMCKKWRFFRAVCHIQSDHWCPKLMDFTNESALIANVLIFSWAQHWMLSQCLHDCQMFDMKKNSGLGCTVHSGKLPTYD